MAKGKRKILVVDDDPHIVRLLKEKLTSGGRIVLGAGDGLEAVKAALREIPDLIILDVMMPRMDGYQVCRYLRSIPALNGSRILFLTVKQGVGDRQRGLLRGADDYLTKPFELDELEKKVAALLRRRGGGRALAAAPERGPALPAHGEITDEAVITLLNRLLDENVHRLTLLEQVSQRLLAAVDRADILKVTMAAAVSPVGLGWERALLMSVNWEKGTLEPELAFALAEKPEEGLPQWKNLVGKTKDRTMEEVLDSGMRGFRFQTPERDSRLASLGIRLDTDSLRGPFDSTAAAMELLSGACRGRTPESLSSAVFWNQGVTVVPLAGREKIFGFLAVDRFFSSGGSRAEEVDHLNFLCRQAGLALERHVLHQQVQVRAWEYERLLLLNESIINGVDLGVVFLDGGDRVGTWNGAMERFTGLKAATARGRKFFDLLPFLSGTLVEQRYTRCLEKRSRERVGHYACTFRRGRKGIFDIRLGAVRQGGRVIGTVMIWEDVRLRVTLEQKAKDAHRYLASLVDHSGDAIITLDGRGRIKTWNGGAFGIFGHDQGEICGKSFSALFERGNRRAAKELLERTLARGKVVNHLEKLLHRGGETVEVSITTSTISRGADGKADVAAIIRDVSARRRMESQLFQTEKLASLGIMAAGMAHEINNPLTSIMMYSQILGMNGDLGEEDRGCIEKIEEDAGRIADIVNSLLVFSRPSSRQTERVDIHEMLEKALSFIRYQTGRKHIRITRKYGQGVPPLQGVATEIQEVFLNLLVNARDAIGDTGEIRVRSRYYPPGDSPAIFPGAPANGGTVEIEVADDGTGIPRECIRKIYDPFYTTKPPGKGTGLGLAVVQRLVENHQGCIAVQSRPGKGTTFTVCFPAV